MNEAAQTLDGWYALHDFRTIDWTSWRQLNETKRKEILEEVNTLFQQWQQTEDAKEGSTVIYRIVGQKADLAFMHLRETLEELNELETVWNKSALAEYTRPAYS